MAVFGCGLVGASAAAGWSAAGLTVWGADRRDLSALVERGWIARQVAPEELAEAAVVVLALPPRAVVGALSRLPFCVGQIVTDTASVKEPAARAARRHLPAGVAFVGGHPMAGSTGSGFEAAHPELFAGARWVLAPAECARSGTDAARATATVERLVRVLGARPMTLEPARHDRLVALTSHLPQLLSTALAAEIDALDDPAALDLLGPGGRTFLRLAGSPYDLWREIVAENREQVGRALAAVAGRAGVPAEGQGEEFERAHRLLERLTERLAEPSADGDGSSL